jgi:hypothetical protein
LGQPEADAPDKPPLLAKYDNHDIHDRCFSLAMLSMIAIWPR